MRIYGGQRHRIWRGAAFSLIAMAAFAHGARADSQSEPIETTLLSERVDVTPQGLSSELVHYIVRANNAASAQKIGQQPVGYSDSLDELDIVEAFTLKADGRKIPVAASAIFTQMAQGESGSDMLDDRREKLVVFPDVEAGDSIDLTFRRREKQPVMPGAFMFERLYPRFLPYDDAEVTITAPKSLALMVETKELAFDRHDEGANTVFHWRYSSPAAQGSEVSVPTLDASPHLVVSSFKDYDTLARSFATLVAPEMQVTPKIQALADQVTAGTTDRKLQAQKLYEWVSMHVRYVGIEIGVGAIVPHDADAVLANGYGDCKDHVALYSALLKAKGIASEFVLINEGASYTLPATAVLGELDHAITWLPEFGLYADTTAGVAPFGSLPFQEYGKPIVHAAQVGHALRKMPVLPPGLATITTNTVAQVDASGKISGTSAITATGPFSMVLRQIGLNIQAAGTDRVADEILKRANLQGTGRFDVPSPTALSPSYTLSSTWSFGPFVEIPQGKRFSMLFGLNVLGVPGDNLIGPLFTAKLTDSATIPCFSGHTEQNVELHTQAGWHFLAVAPDTTVRLPHFLFAMHWQASGATLHFHTAFTSTLDAPLCTGERRTEINLALGAIRAAYSFGAAVAPDSFDKPMASNDNLRVAVDENGVAAGGIQAGTAEPVAVASLAQPNMALASETPSPAAPVAAQRQAPMQPLLRFPATAPAHATDHSALLQDERAANSAIAASPKSASLYERRGQLRDAMARYDDAAADYARAISFASTAKEKSRYLTQRGRSFWMARDYRPSLADFSEAVRLDDANSEALAGRGRSELFAGKLDASIADLSKAAALSHDPATALLLYVADQRAGKDARADLMAHVETLDVSAPTGPVVGMFLGQAKSGPIEPGQQSGIQFYLGELALIGGDKNSAVSLFHEACLGNTPEAVAAAIELEKLGR